MPNIRLCSSDDEIFVVDVGVAKMSVTIKTMLEDLDNEDDDEIIQMPKISSYIMTVVIKWSTHHLGETFPEESDDDDYDDNYDSMARRSDDIDLWDQELLEPLNPFHLFELIMACNYLNNRGLLLAATKTVANLIKGKSPEEIRLIFNIRIPDDMDDNEADESGSKADESGSKADESGSKADDSV